MVIKPGQYVMVKPVEGTTPLPAEVQQIRFVDTKNGKSAVAVVVEIGELPLPRVLELVVQEEEFVEAGLDATYICTWFDCPEVIEMADPVIVAGIQKRLSDQREHMRLAIQASLQAPRQMSFGGGGKASPASREKQRERAKTQREETNNLREMAIANVMAEKSCTREEAIAFFTELAKQKGY